MVVVGSPNSSNTQRLNEVAERAGCARAALVERAADIDWAMLRRDREPRHHRRRLGARRSWSRRSSAPLPSAMTVSVETVTTADEDMFFPLPRALRGNEAAE